jgi:cbb3-type cytochrome oxidase cytochrome c subunit
MNIHIYDTHVKTNSVLYLHFDVLVNDENESKAQQYAEEYIAKQGIAEHQLTLNSCQFCHSEVANPDVKATIEREGHYILQLERISDENSHA